MKPSKNRSSCLSSLAEDIGIIPEDAPFRGRLHMLFAQIEKEFELLYLENLSLQEKLESCAQKDSLMNDLQLGAQALIRLFVLNGQREARLPRTS